MLLNAAIIGLGARSGFKVSLLPSSAFGSCHISTESVEAIAATRAVSYPLCPAEQRLKDILGTEADLGCVKLICMSLVTCCHLPTG